MLALILSLLPKLAGINFDAIGNLVSELVKYWKYVVIGLLITGGVGSVWEWHHTTLLLQAEKQAHASDIASYKVAQAEADSKAKMIKENLEKESKANATQASADYASLLERYRISVLRYAKDHGGTATARSSSTDIAKGSDGPSEDTVLPVRQSDLEICSENTARLVAGHDWAIKEMQDANQ